ncbi:ChbG/HpnK family deacetylase [Puia sp.]|jgi:hypothetical protein|uniref:ChbG/HpnK family deacetylase n=1 Tax=Puia sp. TaxID=2045100 RepID=UPI002F408F9A
MALSRLIVNADDFGISNTVNRAILESIESGLVTSTSMMANMPGFEDAVMLVGEHPLLNGRIGVHLNLTEGHPLSRPILDCPFFCNDNGHFIYDRKRSLFSLNRHEKHAIYIEMKMQLEKVLAAGIKPTHLDSHHHLHTEWAIAPLVCRLGREYRITRIRLTRNMGEPPGLARRIYKAVFNRWRLGRGPDFRNMDYFGDIEDMKIFSRRGSLDGKKVEIMVHPLFNEEGELVDLDRQNLYRRLWSILEKQPALCISPTDPL